MVTYLSLPVFQNISDTNSPPASLLEGASVDSGRASFGTDDSISGLEVESVWSIHRFTTGFSNDGDELSDLTKLIERLGTRRSHGGNSEENDLQNE